MAEAEQWAKLFKPI